MDQRLNEAKQIVRALLGVPPPRIWKKWPVIHKRATQFLRESETEQAWDELAELQQKHIESTQSPPAPDAALLAALREQEVFWHNAGSGVDLDADPNDDSPEDMFAHVAGLAVREIRDAIAQAETAAGD